MRFREWLPTRRPLGAVVWIALTAMLSPGLASAEWIDLGSDGVDVTVLESDGQRSLIEVTVGGFESSAVDIEGETYYEIGLPREGRSLEAGLPGLPNVRRAVVIPDDLRMAVRLVDFEYRDFTDLPVAPSKGNLPRTVDPATVPYSFDPFYAGEAVFPATRVAADPPHIMRDFRGLVVGANVFQYLPASRTLRVYTRMVIEVAPDGPGEINVLERSAPLGKVDRQFAKLYENHFVNFGADRYVPVLEDGGLLIITYDAFLPTVQPLAAWKNQKGIPTKLVTLSETGSSYTQIKNYILNEYNLWGPAYVLLVGDAAQLPTYASISDPGYSQIVGGDDYPDLFVGRFSAENANHVITQVERTIAYERDQAAGAMWAQNGMGVASNQGPGHYGEYDDDHMNFIRADLLGYGYVAVDQIYDPTASAAMVAAGLNTGRGIVNYCGHGSTTSWGSSGFSNTHVNALVNDGMLPFISSVACLNGNFISSTCFGEAWLRATNGDQATGAIACYMSVISQSWDPPMYAQDESVDLLIADAMRTTGGLWFNGSCLMMDAMGASGVNEFENWTIFGDPSLAVRTKAAEMVMVDHAGVLLIGMDGYEVTVAGVEGALCALYADGMLYGAALTDGAGNATITMADPPTVPMNLTLTVTSYNKVTSMTEVPVLPPEGPYLVCESVTVDDAAGDGDGVLDEGETVGLMVMLENVGVDFTTNVVGTLSCDDPYVTITDGTSTYPDIPASGFGTNYVPYAMEIAGDIPDGHLVTFALTASAVEGSWEVSFNLPAQAPLLGVDDLLVNDGVGGNANGGADAGETFTMEVVLGNVGHSDANGLSATLTSEDPYVIILDAAAACDAVAEGGTGLLSRFEVEILADCPEPTNVMCELEITGPAGFAATLAFEIPVGGWFDDMEANRGWIVGLAGDTATAGIWERADPNGTVYNGHVIQMENDHTPEPGTLCFVTGNGSVGGTAGENDVDGGKTTLLTPVFDLADATSATVSYWRWYTNSWGNNPDEDWWNVEVTNDGVIWVSLEHTQATLAEWTLMTFELTDYITLSDHVQIRFVADDASLGSLVEAGIDDFLMYVVKPVATGVDDSVDRVPGRLALAANYPNPFNPKTTIRFDLPRTQEVALAVYDISGKQIATLVSGELAAGQYEVTWLGRDHHGQTVASGLYFYRLEAGSQVLTRKMTLLK